MLLVATVATLALASVAAAQTKPIEQVVLEGDLVVVGKVVEVGQPAEMKIRVAGQEKPMEADFITYTLEIEKRLKPAPADDKNDKADDKRGAKKIRNRKLVLNADTDGDVDQASSDDGDEKPERIKVLHRVSRAKVAKKNVRVQVRGNITVTVRGGGGQVVLGPNQGGNVPVQGAVAPTQVSGKLRDGQKCLLVLQKLPDRKEYYLSAERLASRPATEENVARYTAAVDVDKWAWGKSRDDLQLTLLPGASRSITALRGRVNTLVTIAMRNTGKDPIHLNLTDPGQRFGITATDANGDDVDCQWVYPRRRARSDEPEVVTVQPGKIAFFSYAKLPGHHPGMLRMQVEDGAYSLQLIYGNSLKTAGEGDDVRKLWTGEVSSAKLTLPVETVEVQPMRPRPLPAPRPLRPKINKKQ